MLVDGQRWRRLVGVFDGRGFAFFVELLGGLRVLIGLVLVCLALIWGWGSGLLRILLGRILLLRRILLLGRILLVTLLRLSLGANSEDCGFCSRSLGGQRLIVADWREVGVCWIRAGVVGNHGGLCGVGVAVTTCGADES